MSDHWEAAPRHMMRLDIRSLLQDAAIEEVRISVLVKITNYVDVTILKIQSREKYSHNRAGILGTVESQNHCVRQMYSIFLINYPNMNIHVAFYHLFGAQT